MKLPVSIPLHDGETPLGFVSRLAAANGYPSMGAFLDCTETTALSIARGSADAMRLLEAWSGEDHERLAKFAIRNADRRLCFGLGNAVFGRDHRRGNAHRFCIQCVRDDFRCEAGRKVSRPYVRAWWETRTIKTCPIHGTWITEVARENNEDDFTLFVRSNEHLLTDDNGTEGNGVPRELDRYLIGRIRGEASNPFLDRFEAYVVAGLSKYFGRFLRRYRGPETSDDSERGFNAVKQGEAHIRAVVSDLILGESAALEDEAAPMEPIPRWLRRNLDAPAYAPLIELFQDLAERTMPLGEGDVCILPTRKRYRHTVRSASVEYGLMEPRVTELMTKAGLLEPEVETKVKPSFDAELARPILEAARDTLSLTEAAAILDLNGPRLHEIIDAGLLPRVEADRGDLRIYTRIRKQDLADFQARLFERSKIVTDLERYLPIVNAAHRCNCQLRELVEMVLDGQLRDIARIGDSFTFPHLLVNLKEAQETRRLVTKQAIGTELLAIKEAAAVLKTTQAKVYPLVESGMLAAVEKLNPATRRMQSFIEPKTLETFQSLHISVADIAAIYGTRADIVLHRMEQLGVEPNFDPGKRSGRYYWRRDLDKFTFEPLAA